MDYRGVGGHHLQYAHTLPGQLDQLTLSQGAEGQRSEGREAYEVYRELPSAYGGPSGATPKVVLGSGVQLGGHHFDVLAAVGGLQPSRGGSTIGVSQRALHGPHSTHSSLGYSQAVPHSTHSSLGCAQTVPQSSPSTLGYAQTVPHGPHSTPSSLGYAQTVPHSSPSPLGYAQTVPHGPHSTPLPLGYAQTVPHGPHSTPSSLGCAQTVPHSTPSSLGYSQTVPHGPHSTPSSLGCSQAGPQGTPLPLGFAQAGPHSSPSSLGVGQGASPSLPFNPQRVPQSQQPVGPGWCPQGAGYHELGALNQYPLVNGSLQQGARLEGRQDDPENYYEQSAFGYDPYSDYYYDDYYGYVPSEEASTYLPLGQATSPYGDRTVEDLGPEEVRWFYKSEGDKKWTPFIGYDSLRIEWKYQDLLQGESFRSPGGGSSPGGERGDKVPQRIVVRGGLYEVDVGLHKCESLYWQGEVYSISRGTWFYDGTWGPVEESLAERIEYEHLTHFRGHLLSSQRLDDSTKEVVHSLSLPEGEVDWFSASEVYLSSDATPSRLMRSVGKKFGFQKTGYRLQRGYSIDATSSDKPPDVNHIVFVIHGIGQKMERGRIIKNCTALRESISYLKHKYFPSVVKSSHTVEFFPVEWRSSLVLDAGVIDSITPQKILNIRQMLNASFMDIMYYNSPLYREEIITGLTGEMNRLYTMFTQRNPYFEANGGKVSMVAHSLGCVITYDIVTGWNPAQQYEQQLVQSLVNRINRNSEIWNDSRVTVKKNLQDLLNQHDYQHTQPSLNFKIENFFCLGSPLAVFLALRTKQSQDIIPQKLCKRLLNIYHPADPVAYRIEPLLCSDYANIAPVLIHSYNAAEKVPYCEMPLEPITGSREREREAGDKSRANSGNNTPVSSAPSTPVKGGASSWSLWGLMKGSKKPADSGPSSQELTSALQDVRNLTERTDFMLREGSMENSYISAITSHTSYWSNYDVSHFMLSVLYPDIQPTSSKPEVVKP